MKRLISPPIQSLLWLAGIACLALAAWNIWELRQKVMAQVNANSEVAIAVNADAATLNVNNVGEYRQLVEAPLFWELRSIPRKPPPAAPKPVAVKQAPQIAEVELMPPQGRLVGIVDLGSKKYALIRNENENQSLHLGDVWEGWTVANINKERVALVAGKQRTEISLIGEFSAPQPNKQILATRQRQQQRQKHQQRQQRLRKQQVQQRTRGGLAQPARQQGSAGIPLATVKQLAETLTQPGLADQLDQLGQQAGQVLNAAMNQQEQGQQPAPVLSIKDALEARQRLMSSRWGKDKATKGQ